MPFFIVRDDITRMNTDAIVNAANPSLLSGGGVCGAIFAAAGQSELTAACVPLAPCETGCAVITPGFRLPAKYIIHTVGPRWRGGGAGEKEKLASCYLSSLALARRYGLTSVAFPLISSGIYGVPTDIAFSTATDAILRFLGEDNDDISVTLVIYDRASFPVNPALYGDINSFIEASQRDSFLPEFKQAEAISHAYAASPNDMSAQPQARVLPKAHFPHALRPGKTASKEEPALCGAFPFDDLEFTLDAPFFQKLLRVIDSRSLRDAEVYRRANIDRKLFSKLRHPDYRPGKNTVLALCIALSLSEEEARELLSAAGFTFSNSSKADMIVLYFIRKRWYDIYAVNEALFAFDQALLGAK